MKNPVLLLLLALLIAARLCAEVRLGSPFGDHMVLQQGRSVPVWGTAAPGEKVTVAFAGQKASTIADAAGHWRINLKKLKTSSKPRELIVSSVNRESKIQNLKLHDVLVGEVWLCGGQSNMERQLGLRSGQKPIVNGEAAVAWAASGTPTARPTGNGPCPTPSRATSS